MLFNQIPTGCRLVGKLAFVPYHSYNLVAKSVSVDLDCSLLFLQKHKLSHVAETQPITILRLPLSTIVKQGKSEGFDSCDRPSNLKLDSNRPCDREILWMTSKNNRALLLYYVKLCASFQIHWWIQTGFTVQKRSIRVEIGDMSSPVTLKFDGWPWKIIGHLFYATSSLVQHFVPIGEFKLKLQSGNAQFGSKLTIFFSRVTSKFDGWPSKTIAHLFCATSSFVQHFVPIGEFKLELQSGNAQSGSNSTIFRAVWPWNLTDDLEKQ